MNKKTNTLLFVLGATVANVIVTLLCFMVLVLVFTRYFMHLFSENTISWVMPIFFVLSIVASFLIYRAAVKLLMKKVDMEKYFDPIFGPRRPQRKSQ